VRRTTLAAALAVAAAALPATAHAGELHPGDYAPDRLIVRFHAAVPAPERAAALRALHAKLKRALPIPRTALVRLPRGSAVPAAGRALARDSRIAWAEPDSRQHGASAPADPLFGQQWGLHNSGQDVEGVSGTADADIDAPEAWDRTTGSPAVRVAIVDSGINLDSPDLAPAIATNPGETGAGREDNGVDDDGNGFVDDWRGWDFVQEDNDPSDTYAHGTHVAGIVAARAGNAGITGVAPRTSLIPVRVLDNLNEGTCSEIASGMYYAVRDGADVVNVSIGSYYPCLAEQAVIESAPDVLFVVAAMNDSSDVDEQPAYPCAFPSANIVCVAATDADDRLAGFSNYGASAVDLGAPGENVLSNYLKWGARESLFSDGFETSLTGRWVTGGFPDTWGRSFVYWHSGSYSLTDSPFGEFENDADNYAALAQPLDLTDRNDCAAIVWTKTMLGALDPSLPIEDQDMLLAETSPDGYAWGRRPGVLFGDGGWGKWYVDLSELEGRDTGSLRFRLISNSSGTAEGVALDDFEVICVPVEPGYTGAADEYAIDWGTSMAAPHVSGVAALILALRPGASAAELKQRLLASVDRVPALAGKTVTGGRLNAARAVAPSPPPANPPSGPPPPSVPSGGSRQPPPSAGAGVDAAALEAAVARLAKRLRKGRIRALLRNDGVTARGVVAPGAGYATILIERRGGRTVARGGRKVDAAGDFSLTARLTGRGRALLRRSRRVRLSVAIAFAPVSGEPAARSARAVVKR
jgi:subtilisin family serine protease